MYPAALQARTYAADLDVVIAVSDPLLPHNDSAFRLQAGTDGGGRITTRRRADVTLTVRDLGAIYLGGTSLSSLHAAGLVGQRRAGAVTAMTAAFTAPAAVLRGQLLRRSAQTQRYSSIALSSVDFDLAPLKALTSSPLT